MCITNSVFVLGTLKKDLTKHLFAIATVGSFSVFGCHLPPLWLAPTQHPNIIFQGVHYYSSTVLAAARSSIRPPKGLLYSGGVASIDNTFTSLQEIDHPTIAGLGE